MLVIEDLNEMTQATENIKAAGMTSHCDICGSIADSQTLRVLRTGWQGNGTMQRHAACSDCHTAADAYSMRTRAEHIGVAQILAERTLQAVAA